MVKKQKIKGKDKTVLFLKKRTKRILMLWWPAADRGLYASCKCGARPGIRD
jgi:hypothetical protein